jgi:hypothetical protein
LIKASCRDDCSSQRVTPGRHRNFQIKREKSFIC